MSIPSQVGDDEKIMRGVYHPMNFHAKKNEIHLNLFRSPKNKDEVSVIRFDFISIDEARSYLIKHNNSEKRRTYCGFCILIAIEIIQCGCSVVSSPLADLPQHADIIHGYALKEGEEAPVELKIKWEGLLGLVNEKKRYFHDINTESSMWEGGEILINV
jgi:hypothetical protein